MAAPQRVFFLGCGALAAAALVWAPRGSFTVRKREGAWSRSWLCMHGCEDEHAARLCRVLLAHLGVHRRCGLARRAPSRVGVDDDDLACRIRLAQRVVPLVHALQADDVAILVLDLVLLIMGQPDLR